MTELEKLKREICSMQPVGSQLDRFATLCRADLVAEVERLNLQSSIVKEERDNLRSLHESVVIEIGKMCGEDLTEEPRAKWALLEVAGVVRERDALKAELARVRAGEPRIVECASRLVQHADFQLGGCLSADSKAKDIPSKAVSQVKSRHLAALRDALSATTPQPAAQEPVVLPCMPEHVLADRLNPYPIGSPRSAWKAGFLGTTNFGAKGSDNDRQWNEGAKARKATPPSAVPVVEQLVEAFIKIARMAEALKKDCGMDPESLQAIRNCEYMNISHTARAAIAAGQKFIKENGK